jgi:hypothetical protein
MIRKACLAAALAVALYPLTAAAQEYTIKVKRPGLGDKNAGNVKDDFKLEFKLLDEDNNAVMEAEETKAHKFVFRETGLERAAAGDQLVKIKRHYEHAERTVKGKRETLPYQGKTVLIEKKDGRFEFRIEEGGEVLEGQDAEELNEEFNKGDFRGLMTQHFLPRKAVKLNETWKFDVAPLAKAFTGDGKIAIDDAKSTGTGRLVKAYTKNGKQYGVIELTINFPVTHMDHDGNRIPTKEGKLTIKLQADTCIDGTFDEFQLTASLGGGLRAEINANGMDLNLTVSLHANLAEKRSPVK